MYARDFLSLDEARAIAEAALAEALKDPDRPVAIAVADIMGDLVYFIRQDNTPAHTCMLAISKAYTAARFRKDTADVGEHFVKKLGWSLSYFPDPKYTAVPGGMCIKSSDGTVLGAVGISGRILGDKISDRDIGAAGLNALAV